jgi:two-component system, cell cycle response regulator
MATMRKEILVYEKDRNVLKFLHSFFNENKDYSVHFVDKKDALKETIMEEKPDAVILSSPDGLSQLQSSEVACPIIGIISTDETKGIHSAVKADVECYLLSPFHKEELEYKLKSVVDKKHWIEKLFKESDDFYALIDLASLASSTLDPKEVLYLIVKKISEIINVTRCSMISINAGNRRFAKVVSTFEDPKITDITIDLQKYPEIRKALLQKQPVIIRDAQKDPLMEKVRDIISPIGIRSIIVIPVIFRDEVIGTLLLRTSRAGRAFTNREIKLCSALANASSNALYNAFLYERLNKEKAKYEKLAITDYLTGIYNIRYFYKRLDEEFSRAQRYKVPLSCVMIDIDHFKKVNDKYGHRIGDIVLREFAQLIKRHTRKCDLFARYGGEEFILLLPQTAAKGAMIEAERLRRAVKEHRFRPFKAKQQVTVSLGAACTSDVRIKNYDELIHHADNALFKAKEKGRDQTVVYSSL